MILKYFKENENVIYVFNVSYTRITIFRKVNAFISKRRIIENDTWRVSDFRVIDI